MGVRWPSMTVALAVGVTTAVVVVGAGGVYLFSLRHYRSALATARTDALAQGRLIHAALEHQMIENDRSLIDRMIRTFGREPGVESVMLLDREGRLRYSSAPDGAATVPPIDSPTCQACHRFPPSQRVTSQVIDTAGGELLRTVVPFRNREACYGCHDKSHLINGILIVDRDTRAMQAAMTSDLRFLAAGSAALAFLLLAALAVVMRLVVTRRLQAVETAARKIAAGELDRRVPIRGSDTLAWLGAEFNTMAETMTGLLRDVRSQHEQLEVVINGIDDGIVVLDAQRTVIAANDAFLRRTGRSRSEVLGTTCHDAARGTCGTGDCPTQACLRTGERQVRICERRVPTGGTVWEEVHASPIRHPSRGLVQVVEVWRDISDRRSAEARLAESHRLASLGLLASGFSHELNTPLATALLCVEGIQRTSEGAVAENASIAREQLLRCRGVTQHFLKLSRGRGVDDCLVDLAATIEAVTRLIEPTARAHAVDVRVEPVPEGLTVRANDAELQHVLVNLVLNAIQACERRGTVVVATRSGDPVRILVTDDGCGMAPETQKRIFEPFFSGRPGGTGLGLFLSLDFVRHWGGDIRVQSRPGSGSTFEVVFPSQGGGAALRVLS